MGGYLIMSGAGKVTAQQFTMTQLANFLGQSPVGLGRMVKDKTGLTGKYNFTMTFQMAQGFGPGPPGGPAPAAATGADAEDPQPSIFTAVQDNLGLKLQPGTGTIDTVVVEHVERPSAD